MPFASVPYVDAPSVHKELPFKSEVRMKDLTPAIDPSDDPK